ncbi:MAG TPA: sigma 54-interacting transcriptional regulator [Candidatus Acidoferrales bacterium]|nr:sigma 54-interacting transcriptional regulator [Candidatus Acidoferrales bacterium]
MPGPKQIRALLAIRNEMAANALRGYLRARGDVVELACEPDLHSAIRSGRPDLTFLELQDGEAPLASLRQAFPDLGVVAVAPPNAAVAFAAAKLGARELLTLPLDKSSLQQWLSRLFDGLPGPAISAAVEVETLPAPEPLPGFANLFNSSPRMVEVRETIEKVANTSATVLIRGESGVGKEIAARLIFSRSQRSQKPFVKVNCAAIPNDLLESELFGYEAGAFTGAQRSKPGKFELADGGTLFLDEIGEMHPALQAKLLHALQDGEFARLGSKRDTAVDVRVICATNKLLEERVAAGMFREDLFYRINVVTVHIPPLRERPDEIPVLIRHFIEKYSALYERTVDPFEPTAMQVFAKYAWPGNIRELENICKRYVIVGNASQILREISLHSANSASKAILNGSSEAAADTVAAQPSLLEIGRQAAWQAERRAILDMLVKTRWNRREAATRLRVSYKALLNKINRMELEQEEDLRRKGHVGS